MFVYQFASEWTVGFPNNDRFATSDASGLWFGIVTIRGIKDLGAVGFVSSLDRSLVAVRTNPMVSSKEPESFAVAHPGEAPRLRNEC